MNAARWPFSRALLLLIALELIYKFCTQALIDSGDANGITVELMRSGLRLASAGVVWYLFHDLLIRPQPKRWNPGPWTALAIVALVIDFAIPILCGNWNLPEGETRLVFALASFPVGLREELVYRGALQTLLEKRFGLTWAIGLTTVAFACMHIGAQPINAFTVSLFIASGIIYGLLYARTRSLWLVIILHTAFDAIYCYTPLLANPWEPLNTIPLLVVATLLTLGWFMLSQRKASA